MLPKSLQSLSIDFCDGRVVPKLESLSSQVADDGKSFHDLQKIYLEFALDSPFTDVHKIGEQLSRLRSTAILHITVDVRQGYRRHSWPLDKYLLTGRLS